MLKDEIVRLVDGLANGDTADDLDQGVALDINGRRALKSRTLAIAGRDSQLGEIGTHELCSLNAMIQLNDLSPQKTRSRAAQ